MDIKIYFRNIIKLKDKLKNIFNYFSVFEKLNNKIRVMDDRFSNNEKTINHLLVMQDYSKIDPNLQHSILCQHELILGVSTIYGNLTQGDIAEFGTQSGRTAEALAKSMINNQIYYDKIKMKNNKNLHLFDSFSGLPKIGKYDKSNLHVKNKSWSENSLRGITASELKSIIKKHLHEKNIFIYEGYFKNSLKKIKPSTKFSLIHLDCDLYESSYDVLDYLFKNKHINEGCLLFLDDFNLSQANKHHGMQAAFNEISKKHGVDYTKVGYYGLYSLKVIIHNYKK